MTHNVAAPKLFSHWLCHTVPLSDHLSELAKPIHKMASVLSLHISLWAGIVDTAGTYH